mgnify:CR=1 FL=1
MDRKTIIWQAEIALASCLSFRDRMNIRRVTLRQLKELRNGK